MTDTRKNANARGYGHRWQKARLTFLKANPLCIYCQRLGRIEAATVVDHKEPHGGDTALFWDSKNWQPLCKPCHDRVKQAEERRGHQLGAGTDGYPIDPNHHWNR